MCLTHQHLSAILQNISVVDLSVIDQETPKNNQKQKNENLYMGTAVLV